MSRFEELKEEGWTPIGYTKIDDLRGDYSTPEKQATALADLFKQRGLDITKPHRKTFEPEHRAWFFKQDEDGQLITLDDLKLSKS
jgi:hypothetical protein